MRPSISILRLRSPSMTSTTLTSPSSVSRTIVPPNKSTFLNQISVARLHDSSWSSFGKATRFTNTSLSLIPQKSYTTTNTPVNEQKQKADDYYLQAKQAILMKEFTAALPLLLKASELGSKESDFNLGLMYTQGKGVTADVQKAKQYFVSASEVMGEAAFNLGIFYFSGSNGFPKDVLESERWLKIASQRDFIYSAASDAEALGSELGNLAKYFLAGFTFKQDKEVALRFFEKGTTLGDPTCSANFAALLATGDGLPKDKPRAISILKNLIEKGKANIQVYWNLGLLYYKDNDIDNAVQMFKSATAAKFPSIVDTGFLKSLNTFAFRFLTGEGVPEDEQLALAILQKAIEGGSMVAKGTVGIFHIEGKLVSHDEEKGLKMLQEASDAGEPSSMYNLGALYLSGKAVPKDVNKAVELFEKASKMGHIAAIYELGSIVCFGKEGYPVDKERGMRLLSQASKGGVGLATYNLGVMFFKGDGVEKDAAKASEYFQKAGQQGIPSAWNNLAALYWNGDGVVQNKEHAVDLLIKAADGGIVEACQTLEGLYRNGNWSCTSILTQLGEVVTKDTVKAIEYGMRAKKLKEQLPDQQPQAE